DRIARLRLRPAYHEQVEAWLVHARPERDRAERALLPEQAVDRIEFVGRSKFQRSEGGRPIEACGRKRFSGGGDLGVHFDPWRMEPISAIILRISATSLLSCDADQSSIPIRSIKHSAKMALFQNPIAGCA